jgi:anaerobic ribonucleoside-triphosphate reductase activating protein
VNNWRYADIKFNDCANGPGVRVSFWAQGCTNHCYNCQNPGTWERTGGQEFTEKTLQLILQKLDENNIERGLSILGGEPCTKYNIDLILYIIQAVKDKYPKRDIYLWTGFTLAELSIQLTLEQYTTLSHNIDYLIDGPYIEAQRNITLPLRGSENQRIYHIKHNLLENGTVNYKYEDITEKF